jgi:hypothetical protein
MAHCTQHTNTMLYFVGDDEDWFAPKPARAIVVRSAAALAQGELFAPTLLPRRLPVFKYGPEDEAPVH